MNGIHDLGGMHGMGPIKPEVDEPVFHEAWEGRAFGLFASTFVFAGYTVDEFRHAIEKLDAAHYLHPFTDHQALSAKGARISTRAPAPGKRPASSSSGRSSGPNASKNLSGCPNRR